MNVAFLDLARAYAELKSELDDVCHAVMASGRYLFGVELASFETEFAHAVGASGCVGLASGLDALTLALRALDIGRGDEVLVPTNTYIATWLAVSAVGATPVGVEPDATHNLDPANLDAAYGPRTRAVIPVHLYGQPAAMPAIVDWAHEHQVRVVADAAQAHGARHRGQPIGAMGDAVTWSFYPTKNLGALGDAGAVTSDDVEVLARVRRLGNYGADAERVTHHERGVNSRLDEIQAAVLRVKLRHLDEWNARRRRHAERYLRELADTDLLLPEVATDSEPVWHQFVVRSAQRDRLRELLAQRGIATLVHYPVPPFAQPAYADLGVPRDRFAVAERLAAEVLSLPVGPHMTSEEQALVIDAVHDACTSLASQP